MNTVRAESFANSEVLIETSPKELGIPTITRSADEKFARELWLKAESFVNADGIPRIITD